MSLRHMVKAFDCKIGSHVQKLVLIKLADNASEDGKCFPSLSRISDECEISRRTTINAIKALEQKGFLYVHREKTSREMNKVNQYTLTLERGESLSLGSASNSLGGESPALGGGESLAPRTSHSFEPPKEPVNVRPDGLTPPDIQEKMKAGFEYFWETWKQCKKDLEVRNNSTPSRARERWDKYFNAAWWKKHTLSDYDNTVNAICQNAIDIHTREHNGFCHAEKMMTDRFFTVKGWEDGI